MFRVDVESLLMIVALLGLFCIPIFAIVYAAHASEFKEPSSPTLEEMYPDEHLFI
jgi:hypothetical protein